MVAQKQALLAAMPKDDPLATAAQMQSQAALDKQVRASRSPADGPGSEAAALRTKPDSRPCSRFTRGPAHHQLRICDAAHRICDAALCMVAGCKASHKTMFAMAHTCLAQVLLSEGELTDSEGDGGAVRPLLRGSGGGRGAALMRSRSQAALPPSGNSNGSSAESDRSVWCPAACMDKATVGIISSGQPPGDADCAGRTARYSTAMQLHSGALPKSSQSYWLGIDTIPMLYAREQSASLLRRDGAGGGGGLRAAPSTMLAPAGIGSSGCIIS